MNRISLAEKYNNRELLTPEEAAAELGVDPKSMGRWARSRMIPQESFIRLPSSHRRYRRSYIEAMLNGEADFPGGADS